MTDSRTRILNRIRQATGGSYDADNIEATFDALCRDQGIDPVPPAQDMADPVATFTAEGRRNGARVTELDNMAQLTQWLRDACSEATTPPTLHLAPQLNEYASSWSDEFNLGTKTPTASDSWALVKAHTAIAETGTVMSLSSECPSGLLFLAERLIVVIDRRDIVDFQEAAWQRLRASGTPPRTVNWITGPSRTADIEQQIQIGAHGPREADYLIIGNQ